MSDALEVQSIKTIMKYVEMHPYAHMQLSGVMFVFAIVNVAVGPSKVAASKTYERITRKQEF